MPFTMTLVYSINIGTIVLLEPLAWIPLNLMFNEPSLIHLTFKSNVPFELSMTAPVPSSCLNQSGKDNRTSSSETYKNSILLNFPLFLISTLAVR